MVGIPFKINAHGQCRLEKDGSNLKLSPYNGNNLVIDGKSVDIPADGVTLAAAGLTADTTYYIYAFESGSDIALEASTTTHAVGASGIEVKSGDESRTLIGMARAITGPAWVDDTSQRFVLSWFNRQNKNVIKAFTATRSLTTGSTVEIHSEIRNEFLTWGDEAVIITADGFAWTTSGTSNVRTRMSIDGTTPLVEAQNELQPWQVSKQHAIGLTGMESLSEGKYYSTLMGNSGTGTAAWGGGSLAGHRTSLKTMVRG